MPSEKILAQKKLVVKELAGKLKDSCAGVLVDYKGINVADDTQLRRELRDAKVHYKVIKNKVLLRAIEEAGITGLNENALTGTTALALSLEDPAAGARILCKYANDNKFFQIKAGFVEGQAIDKKMVVELARLPSKEILITRVLVGLNAPICGFVTVLNGAIKNLAVVLAAIAEKQSA
ncbi:MAG: 50S ribosomal protein L10 [Lactobacillales bacterium]|jgi:large subunit ribosomal protein L10|nr:50S ribosomal protein L10 [Lactobacillales bacterium]